MMEEVISGNKKIPSGNMWILERVRIEYGNVHTGKLLQSFSGGSEQPHLLTANRRGCNFLSSNYFCEWSRGKNKTYSQTSSWYSKKTIL